MDAFQAALDGLAVALTPANLLYVMLGVLVGTVVGALPGFGPATAIAMLLPLTFALEADSAIILLAGIFYGSMYGGRIPSILLNLPGDAPSVITTFDGYPMAKAGKAGKALTITAVASFVGGTVGILALTFLAPPLATIALRFGPPEIALLTMLGVLLLAYLGGGSLPKSLVAAGLGFVLASVGQDPMFGSQRLTFGSNNLLGGISFIAVVMGIFGLGEILYNLEHMHKTKRTKPVISSKWPERAEWLQSRWAMLRGSLIGLGVGMAPGAGAEIASMTSYASEKRQSKTPERFGKGAIEGLAGPETANNAAAMGSFVPLLTLGIPGSVTGALIFGALLLQGITPGPTLIDEHPNVFYGVIGSMYVGNLLLLLLNIPLVGLFVAIVRVRISVLSGLVVAFLVVGAFSISNNVFDIWVMLVFGAVGYIAKKTGFSMGPFALAFVLSPIMEQAFRQSLRISEDGLLIFLTRPVSLILILIGVLLFAGPAVKRSVTKRKVAA